MSDSRPMLDYELQAPVADVHFSVARLVALGYVGLCVMALILMGVIMALQV